MMNISYFNKNRTKFLVFIFKEFWFRCIILKRIDYHINNLFIMGLLTILKKMKQKEKEVRLLMLYPYETSIEFGSSIRF